MQVIMGSKKAELYQKSVGKKRKKLDARAFKALFKRQRIKEGLPDVDGKLEGPDNMSHICNGNGSVISSKPIGEGEDVSDEFCKKLAGNLRHLINDKASGGDLQKSIGNLRRADADILGNNVTMDSNYIDDVVAESPNPLGAESLTDPRTDSSARKNFDDSERLPTGCSFTKDRNTLNSGSADCITRPQHVDPAIVQGELTELQGTQVAASKEGPSTVTANHLTESLQIDSISTDDAPNFMSGRSSFGAEVGTGESDERFSSLSEQKNRHNILRVELRRLCQILKLSEDLTHRVRKFLEYVVQNHDVSSDSPAIMQAFQLSVCWIATLISKQKVDKKDSFNLAKKHLNYQCTKEQVYSIYSKMQPLQLTYLQSSENAFDSGKDWMLADEDSGKEPSHIIDGTPRFSWFKEKNAKIEIKEIVEIILKQKLGMNVKDAGSELHDKIKKIRKKCEKRMKKLVQKQEEEVQGLLRTWEEEKVKFEKDHKLESAVTCFIHGQGLVRTSKLKLWNDKFAKKMEEHNLLKDMQLNSLKEKQLSARNEQRQKAVEWLAEAIACASKLSTVNGPQSFGFQSENGPECTESGAYIMHIGPENVVTVFQEQAKDQNPSKKLCPQGNDVAPSDTYISAPAEISDCGCLVETMSNMEAFNSPNEVGVTSLERPPETPVGHLNQLPQSHDTTEEIASEDLPICGEQITDVIRPMEIYQEGPTQLTRPVSDDIVLHIDPVESNNTSNIGDSIGLPNTEVNHRDEPCQSSSSSLPFPGQPLVHSEKMLPFTDHCGFSKQHVSQDEIHLMASAELEDRDTPAVEIQNISQIEVATSKPCDTVTLVQSNHAVPVTGNCKQPNDLSADASLICNQYLPHEIEHQNGNQGTNFSETVVAGETEEFSREFVSQSSENLHHSYLDLGQPASRISHERNAQVVRSPDNTVVSEAVSTTELPNQNVPQLAIDAGHLHGPRNNDAEMMRSTCVQVSQDEIHQMASAELENLDTPAAEVQNTSQTEVVSDAVSLVQSNHAVPLTVNYEQLHNLSVDASLICNQSPPNEFEHQNGNQVTNLSRTVAAGETEEFSHEFVSQSSENLHHNHLDMGQASRISHEQSVEVLVRSPENTVMAEAVSTTELPTQSVPQLGIDAGHLRGPSHHLIHPTLPFTSWNPTPPLVAEPLQNELEKLQKEAEGLEKMHENVVSQLKSDCEKEIQEIINQIRTKYDMKLEDAEAEFRLKKNELEKNKNLVLTNTRLAEAFRSKFQCRPLQLQQVFPPSFEQHLHQSSLPPPMRISPLASASQPPPSQQTLAPSAQALNQLYMPSSVTPSPVSIRNVTPSPPIQAIQRRGSVLSGTSARPPVITSITPASNSRIAELRSRAPHLQPFRPAAAPSMAPSSFSARPPQHPQPIFRPQLVPTPRPAPPPPPLPQLMPNHASQNTPEPQSGQPFHLNLSQSPIDLRRDMNRLVLMNHNLPPLADVDSTVGSLEPSNLVTLGIVQGNPAFSAVDTDIICLSDEEQRFK